jgi:two-component system sensor histidine kinase/response regulator
LRQVLVNLIENAVKYSGQGRIEVRVEPQHDTTRFSVRDEGRGIPSDEAERVFEKFYRLDPNMTEGVGGTGLGLYICRELIEGMQGQIWVNSGLGKGSTFTFELPAFARR